MRQKIFHSYGSKAAIYGDIPADIPKSIMNIYLDFVTDIIVIFFQDG